MENKNTRTVNTGMFKELVSAKGKFAVEKVVVGASVSSSIVKRTMKGQVPSTQSQHELANYFNVSINKLFPLIAEIKEAA